MFPQALLANARVAVKAESSGSEVDSSKQRKKVYSENQVLFMLCLGC
jgi:hypothetical protein